MNVTLEEFEGLVKLAGYYSTPVHNRHDDMFTEHLLEQTRLDLEFRSFVKNHYPEAYAEWVAIQKVKGEEQ